MFAYVDLTRRELMLFLPLVIGTAYFGLFPQSVLESIFLSTKFLLV
jgi:hypothetical protein